MNKIVRAQLAAVYEELAERERRWRDCDGKLFGMGPDALRKLQAIKAFADAFGWRMVPDDEGSGVSFRFDAERAEALHIPPVCWPENTATYYRPWSRQPIQED